VSLLPPERLPEDPDALALRKDHRAVLDAYRSFLGSPAFLHRIDVAVLTKIATDETAPHRVRARAAEILGNLFSRSLEGYASLLGVREGRAHGRQAGPIARSAVTQDPRTAPPPEGVFLGSGNGGGQQGTFYKIWSSCRQALVDPLHFAGPFWRAVGSR
jgi:hypothetical protein